MARTASASAIAIALLALLALLATHTVAVPIASRQGVCGSSCEFTFCDGPSCLSAEGADHSSTSAICHSTLEILHIDSTGEVAVLTDEGLIPLDEYMPEGLDQNFSPRFFKSFSIDSEDGNSSLSGIGYEKPQGNQADFLPGLCVVVPLTAYQFVNPDTGLLENAHPTDTTTSCIAIEVCSASVFAEPSPGVRFLMGDL